jgi:hypothetical protein
MRYVRVPREVSTATIRSEDFCFSPGRYVRFIPPSSADKCRFEPLDRIVSVRDQTVKIDRSRQYRYAEIGSIDVDTGGVVFREDAGYRLPTDRPQRVASGDVLISTVRTYRKGIGIVTESGNDDMVASKAILALDGVTPTFPHLTLPYVYSFLRTDFFTEQVWALLNRGVYPRMDKGALHRILIPIATNSQVCDYVDALARSIAEKEHAIRLRDAAILDLIGKELASGQTTAPFVFDEPHIKELRSLKRLDAAIYSEGFKKLMWLVRNYKHGSRTPSQNGFTIKPGPSLEIKLLRTRIDSSVPKAGFYALLIPANISEYGTMRRVTWIGTAKSLPLLRQGDVLIGEAGFDKGRTVVLVNGVDRAVTNAHGLVARRTDGDLEASIFFRCIFHWYRAAGLVDLMAVGGSGGHLSPEYFESILIPNFPDSVKNRIVSLYHSPQHAAVKGPVSKFVAYHRDRNGRLGITQLDEEMKALQVELALAQQAIIDRQDVELTLAS